MKNLLIEVERLKIDLINEKFNRETNLLLNEMKKIGIEKLPYSYSALRQFIDPETMNIHYNKHYKGYVKKLNDALSKRDYGDVELENIIKNISRYNKKIRNNAGGAFNHALFWNMLSPTPKKLSGVLYDKIVNQFGSFYKFKQKFEKYAKLKFGSGWVWLVLTNRKSLKIMTTSNQDNPLMDVIKYGGFPLLGLDLWEHSYYLKYQNNRDQYISNFWDVVNWDFVSDLYNLKTKTNLVESKTEKLLLENREAFCPPKTFQACSRIMSNNRFRKIYQQGITNILKSIFYDYWKNETSTQLGGFYDIERKGYRSVLNNLDTNIFAFCLLIDIINDKLDSIGKHNKKFDFTYSPNVNEHEIKRFLSSVNYFKQEIFTKKNKNFVKIFNKLKEIWDKGEKSEKTSLDNIKSFFGDRVEVKRVGGHGNKIDALKGIDAVLVLDNNEKSAQIKPFTDIKKEENKIKIFGSGNVKQYRVDWMIFINNKTNKVLIFDNKPIIEEGNYIFDETSLLYEIN